MKISIENLIGIWGAITGTASLVWHVIKNKSKVIIQGKPEILGFPLTNFGHTADRSKPEPHITCRVLIQNVGGCDTTFDKVLVWLHRRPHNDFKVEPRMEFHLKAHQSKNFLITLYLKNEGYKKILRSKNCSLRIKLYHLYKPLEIKRTLAVSELFNAKS